MEFTSKVAQTLHQEHVAVIALMDKLSAFVGKGVPSFEDSSASRLIDDVITGIEGEITDHFQFEEVDLFPILRDEGDGDMADLLSEDHEVILPIGKQLVEKARNAKANGFTDESWTEFRRLGGEFAERLTDHASKEEIGLVPLIDETLEDDVDERLAAGYTHN